MEEKKSVLGSRLGFCALGTALLALIVYACTMAGYVFPGQSTHLFTQWMGMEGALQAPSFPLWGCFVRAVGGASFPSSMAVRMNLFSLVCGVLASGLLCLLTGFFVRRTIKKESSLPYLNGASMAAAIVTGFVFVFSPAVWAASTHLDYQIFDVCFALVLGVLFVPMARGGRLLLVYAFVQGLGVGVGLVEGPIFAPLVPIFLLALIITAVKAGRKPYLPAGLFLIGLVIGALVFSLSAAAVFLQLPEVSASETGSLDVILEGLRTNVHEIRQWWARPGWLAIIICSVLPFMACLFAAPRGLNDERSWSQYLFHAAMTICTLLAIATPLSPASLMHRFGVAPVATSALVAVVAGYLTAYWLLLFRTAPLGREGTELTVEVKLGGRMAPVVLGAFLILIALSAVVTLFSASRNRGAFADTCAAELLDRLGTRTWLVTDGLLDDHLRILAASRGQELNLICLQRDMDDAYLRDLVALVKEKGLKSDKSDLAMSAQLGVLPFLQDWFAGDPTAAETVGIFDVPDILYRAQVKPIPECMFFGGRKDLSGFDGPKAAAEFQSFWKRVEPTLSVEKGQGSHAIGEVRDPLVALRLKLRRHIGFVANNLGVMLQDMKLDKEAFALYELVLKTIDPDNISALCNEYEMVRAGTFEAVGHKKEIDKQLKAVVDDPSRRYVLWSLAHYYGYIRSAEIFARAGYSWAHSATPGNAISHLEHARDLVPKERQTGLLEMLAIAYANDNQVQKSREIYDKILADDSQSHEAYMGLMRLALKQGDFQEAVKNLELAVKCAKGGESQNFDTALLLLMRNDLNGARLALQNVTDLKPNSLQAWALLAGTLIQQHDDPATDEAGKKKLLDELEDVILPKMQAISNSPRNYYVQMIRALVLLRKGARKEARDALLVASEVCPTVAIVGDMILNLDMSLLDRDSAEKHARQLLRQNRHNKLANYVMGSIRLQQNDLSTAEVFLRNSVEQEHPLASALNDLAEVLRRQKKYAEAEKAARDATKADPELYVAWETLAAILLDQNKAVDEAAADVQKAIDLVKKITPEGDPRMLITLARAQLAQNDITHFNTTMRTLNGKRANLEPFERAAIDELQKAARSKR